MLSGAILIILMYVGGKNLTENNIIKRDKLNISVHNSLRFSLEISDDISFFWSLMPYPSALKILVFRCQVYFILQKIKIR